MVGWHHRLDGHEFEQALVVGDRQGSLMCCSPWGCKEPDTTEQLNWTDWWLCNPTPGHIFREKHDQKGYMYPVFTAALFTVAKTWKQPKCPLTEEWIKKMWYKYTNNGILLSYLKEWNKAICSNMRDLEIVILSEVSQRRNIIWYPLHVESKKKWYKWTYKTATDSQTMRMSFIVAGGWMGEGIVREFGVDMYTLLYLKWITNKVCIAHGALLNVMWQLGWEGSLGVNGYMKMYG